ncbi:MAG TPA: excinuclease ABC subunit UvrC [Candidatus Doudnabacteria bacterium]|nr:excinuclease ABC subunit UvrC [Candidatus Doudnabacteria bacterium]
MSQLKEKLDGVPRKPGVYKFLSGTGTVLYVGKAKNLRARLGQYFAGSDTRAQLPFLMAEATDFDYIVVNSELESLFLENTLIKEYLPPYNIMLRDDKNYAFIKIDYSTAIPQITYVRKVESNPSSPTGKNRYFGPYSSTKKIGQTLDLVRRVFHFCSNKEVGKRPCFYYFLHRCPGVCIGLMSLEEYDSHIQKISLFLSGQTAPIVKQIQADMKVAARRKQFEKAARLRDEFKAIAVLQEKQLTVLAVKVSWDFISIYCDSLTAGINLFKVREGKLMDKENFLYQNLLGIPEEERGATILQAFSEMYYAEATDLPKEIFTQIDLPNKSLLAKLLATRTKTKIAISSPTRGQKLKLIVMGETNAKEHLMKWQRNQASNADLIQETLAELKKILKLPSTPRRIEGYDISNTQGTNPVGSMVVTKDGIAAKSEYRKFKITGKQTPDDFAMMKQMLQRRLTRVNPSDPKDAWPIPDLLVIDGGKGQLKMAIEALKEAELRIPVIGLAKRIEEIFLPNQKDPIVLSHDNPVLQLLQRLRDEAHRFGITFHKSLRSKQATKSALDSIPGIGPKTKKLLKQKIGTVDKIKRAPIEELTKLVGEAKAEALTKYLK